MLAQSLMWVEAGTPEEHPRVQEGDRHNLTDTTIVDHVDQTRVATLRTGFPLRYVGVL